MRSEYHEPYRLPRAGSYEPALQSPGQLGMTTLVIGLAARKQTINIGITASSNNVTHQAHICIDPIPRKRVSENRCHRRQILKAVSHPLFLSTMLAMQSAGFTRIQPFLQALGGLQVQITNLRAFDKKYKKTSPPAHQNS